MKGLRGQLKGTKGQGLVNFVKQANITKMEKLQIYMLELLI